MLGALHARRLYDDKKIEEARAKGVEFEFHPDVKTLEIATIALYFKILGFLDWLKEGLRPIDSDSCCLVSPVDGTVMRFGELRGPGAMIEQVKGCSYSASSLLGANSFLPMIAAGEANEERGGEENTVADATQKSWWRISFASPKVRDTESSRPLKGLFYCVIYLKPGDYHRIHSPVDWNVLLRRHFTGHLFPMNERATRTIRNLYVENERVVLEGQWQEGYMAMAAIGATNIGSIEVE
ncbi:UNVERIFIED_CONTAM: Phosphatidylserine decarboxylase proenzyme 1, mitochondrial [Sesamum angustifolium]|uniref:phosphatidylserine decarboxylase n=1 Tax=Sesamum angustifolium TaxID=2727405 RepID=A0AAW2MM28_9LAMI